MNDNIKSILNSIIPLSESAIKKVQEITQIIHLSKGTFITQTGNNNNLEYFVLRGVCKSCLNNVDGEEITLSFFMPNTVISPFTTRSKEGKSILNIKCLTDVEIATMDAHKFETLMIEDEEIRIFGNTVLRNELMDKVQKEIGLASLPSKNRLQILRKKYPNIENLVAHTDIASYLGITPISLSRLRSKI